MNKLIAGVFVVMLAGCATAIPGVGLPISGIAIDKENGERLQDVFVVLQVDAVAPWQGWHCAHVEVAKSGADGAFSTSGWVGRPLLRPDESYAFYRSGYILDSAATAGEMRIYMRRDVAPPLERLRELSRLVSGLSCLGDPSPDVVRLYEHIAQEMEALAGTEEERERYRNYMKGKIAFEEQRISNVRSKRD